MGRMHMPWPEYEAQENLWESVLSFHHMGFWDWTLIIGVGENHLEPWRSLCIRAEKRLLNDFEKQIFHS